MGNRKPLTDKNGEVRELTEEDFAAGMSFDQLPKELQIGMKSLNSRGRPKASSPKKPIKIRLDSAVLSALRASGRGWQTRINSLLVSALAEGKI